DTAAWAENPVVRLAAGVAPNLRRLLPTLAKGRGAVGGVGLSRPPRPRGVVRGTDGATGEERGGCSPREGPGAGGGDRGGRAGGGRTGERPGARGGRGGWRPGSGGGVGGGGGFFSPTRRLQGGAHGKPSSRFGLGSARRATGTPALAPPSRGGPKRGCETGRG